jgi:hypothetical protein
MPNADRKIIILLFRELLKSPQNLFPADRQCLSAPSTLGVYIIRDPNGVIAHVGMTPKAKNGLHQRLYDHLYGRSSFVQEHLKGDGSRLRQRYSYQFLEVPHHRHRALLESFAAGWLCPIHIRTSESPECFQST